jgi:hypothetical protein
LALAAAARLNAAVRAAQGEDNSVDDADDESDALDLELLRDAAAPEDEAELLPDRLAPGVRPVLASAARPEPKSGALAAKLQSSRSAAKAKPRAPKTTARAPADSGAASRDDARGSAAPVASSVPAVPGAGPSTAAASLAPQPQPPNGDGSG